MRRFLFNAIVIASAVLSALLWAAWAHTWVAQDTVQRSGWVEEDRRFVSYGLAWSDGRLSAWSNALAVDPDRPVADQPVAIRYRSAPATSNNWGWAWAAWESHPPRPVLAVGSWRVPGQYSSWSGGIRILPVATAASVLPALWVSRFRRSRRVRREGLCPNCLYDLRATPSRCPECGYEPQPA